MYKRLFFITLTSLIFSISSVYAGCTNIIKNNSKSPWTVVFPDYKQPPVAPYLSLPKGYTATIPPGSSLEVRFATTFRFGHTKSIDIMDKQGKSYKFYYDSEACPYIQHIGPTGSVSVNEPKQGDITIEQDLWDDSLAVPHSTPL